MSTATVTAPATPLTFREVLRIDVIRRIWYAQLVSLFGDFLALFAVIAAVSFRMQGTPAQLTGVQIAYMLPMVFVGPIAGVFVDRWPLKPTLIASDLIRALHANAGLFGIVSGAVGVGMIVGTQAIRGLAARLAHDTLVVSGLAGIGAGVFILGAVPLVAAALGATFTIGFAFTAIMVPAQTLMQRETPPDMLGRVASTQISVMFLAQILGLVLSGTLAERFGVRMVFFLYAALSVGLVVAGRLFLRSETARA